jgi:hypothetical protein
MGEVLPLRPGLLPADEPTEGPFEPDPALLEMLERAMRHARSGELLSFIMVYETPGDGPRCLYHTDAAADLSTLLVGLSVEQHRLTAFLADSRTVAVTEPDEGA